MADSLKDLMVGIRARQNSLSTKPDVPMRPMTSLEQIAATRESLARASEARLQRESSQKPSNAQEHNVTRVIDGDTIEVEGVGVVRLTGFDAPETVHPTRPVQRLGPESSRLASIMFHGRKVRITPQAGDERDVYGRMLATVTLPDGRTANAALESALNSYSPLSEVSAISARTARRAARKTFSAGIMRGLIYPIGALVPDLYDSLTEDIESSKAQIRNFMNKPEVFDRMGRPSDTIQSVVAGAPSVAGELIGGLAPGVGLYKAANSVFRIAEGTTVSERVARSMKTGLSVGAGFGVTAKLEEGESRYARIARDALIGGATDAIAIPFLIRAWRSELGTGAEAVVRDITQRLNVSRQEAEKIAAGIRSGADIGDFEQSEKIFDILAAHPGAKGSPIENQAAMSAELLDDVLPDGTVKINNNMPPEVSLSFELTIDGQTQQISFPSVKAKGQTVATLRAQMQSVRRAITQAKSEGKTVTYRNTEAKSEDAWNFWKNELIGAGHTPNTTRRPTTSAVRGSVGETGQVLKDGDEVLVRDANGNRAVHKIVGDENPPGGTDPGIPTNDPVENAAAGLYEDPTTTELSETKSRLRYAGVPENHIENMSELDQHVAAAMAIHGKSVYARKSRATVAAEIRESIEQKVPYAVDPEETVAVADKRFEHLNRKAMKFHAPTEREHVTALTKKVLEGRGLSASQRADFPYLKSLEGRVSQIARAVKAEDPNVILPKTTRPADNPKSLIKEVQIDRRTISERGKFVREQGGETAKSIEANRLAAVERSRVSFETTITNIKTSLDSESDPARRKILEKQLVYAEADLAGTGLRPEAPVAVDPRKNLLGKKKYQQTPPHQIRVEAKDGTVSFVHVSNVYVEESVIAGEVLGKKSVAAHPDGGDRHGYVHFDDNSVSLEVHGGNQLPVEKNHYRGDEFHVVDQEKDWGRDIQLFGHGDGSISFSVTPVNRVYQEPIANYGHMNEHGLSDSTQLGRGRTVEGGGSRSQGEILGFAEEASNLDFGRRPAGYVPRKSRGEAQGSFTEAPDVEGRDLKGVHFDNPDPDDAAALDRMYGDSDISTEGLEEMTRGRGRRRNTQRMQVDHSDLSGFHMVENNVPLERRALQGTPEYALTKDMLTSGEPHPEWSSIRRAARIMLKEGYDPNIKLRLRIAREMHRGAMDTPSSLTVGEAADLNFPLVNSSRLFDEASARGIRIMPKGTGVALEGMDGEIRKFADDLDALEAVMKIPVRQVDRRLEEGLEASLNMGRLNGRDPVVDATRVAMPIQLQEIVLKQVARGGKPAAEVIISDQPTFMKAFDVMSAQMVGSRKIRIRTLQTIGPEKTRVLVYDEDLLRARIIQNGQALRELGVSIDADLETIIDQLERIPRGTHILQSNDPVSSIMEAWYRTKSMKGNLKTGSVTLDDTGTSRVYTDAQKAEFNFRRC